MPLGVFGVVLVGGWFTPVAGGVVTVLPAPPPMIGPTGACPFVIIAGALSEEQAKSRTAALRTFAGHRLNLVIAHLHVPGRMRADPVQILSALLHWLSLCKNVAVAAIGCNCHD